MSAEASLKELGYDVQAATLGGVQQKLSEALGELVQVLPVAALLRA